MMERASYYVKDISGLELYCRKSNLDEYYLLTNDPEKVYALDTKKQKRYARESGGKEIYAVINNEPIVIRNENYHPIYAKNELSSEYYPTKNGKEIALCTADNKVVYARDETGTAFYPRDELSNEYVVNNTLIVDKEGTRYIHPRDLNGNFIGNAGPFYARPYEGNYPFQLDSNGDEIYPVDVDGNQYYPNDVAHSKNNVPLYAYTKDGSIIFDKNSNGDEIYLSNPEDLTDVMTTRGLHPLPRYAKTKNGEEIYPKYTLRVSPFLQMEVILNHRYAKTATGEAKYPIDMKGNEYTMDPTGKDPAIVFPNGYPITNDEYIIVPNVNDKPYFIEETNPVVTLNDIENIMDEPWPRSNDYVTRIKSNRPSRSPRQYLYRVKRATTIPGSHAITVNENVPNISSVPVPTTASSVSNPPKPLPSTTSSVSNPQIPVLTTASSVSNPPKPLPSTASSVSNPQISITTTASSVSNPQILSDSHNASSSKPAITKITTSIPNPIMSTKPQNTSTTDSPIASSNSTTSTTTTTTNPSKASSNPVSSTASPSATNANKSEFGGIWKWILGLLVGFVIFAIVFLKSSMENNVLPLQTNKLIRY